MLDVQPPAVNEPELDFSGGISVDEGTDVLGKLIRNDIYSQIIVSPVDFRVVLREMRMAQSRSTDESSGDESMELSSDYAAPDTPLQQKLAEIWQKGLGLKQVGINDNFFELGGHSLLLTQLANRMKKELGVSPKTSLLFDKPTVHSWSEIIESASEGEGSEKPKKSIKRLSREKYRAPAE